MVVVVCAIKRADVVVTARVGAVVVAGSGTVVASTVVVGCAIKRADVVVTGAVVVVIFMIFVTGPVVDVGCATSVVENLLWVPTLAPHRACLPSISGLQAGSVPKFGA